MLVLPTGFALPPLPYLVVLIGGCVLVAVLLFAVNPHIDQRLALAVAPWLAVGGALHAFHQFGSYSPLFDPLFGAPAVYLTTFLITGVVWLLISVLNLARARGATVYRNLALTGTGVLTVLFVLVLVQIYGQGSLARVVWPAIAFVVALAATAVSIFILSIWRTPVFVRTRYVGPVVVFAHALDGVSTAIGTDVLGVAERSPLPRTIMDVSGQLPTADLIGVGWLFVFVKLLIATAVVVAFNHYLEEEPAEATLILIAVIAVGLGPAINNLFLFLATAA